MTCRFFICKYTVLVITLTIFDDIMHLYSLCCSLLLYHLSLMMSSNCLVTIYNFRLRCIQRQPWTREEGIKDLWGSKSDPWIQFVSRVQSLFLSKVMETTMPEVIRVNHDEELLTEFISLICIIVSLSAQHLSWLMIMALRLIVWSPSWETKLEMNIASRGTLQGNFAYQDNFV